MDNQTEIGGDKPAKKYEADNQTVDRLWNDYEYHAPFGDQKERYEQIRARIGEIALWLTDVCPASRELACALTHLEQACFYANAAIARNENEPGVPQCNYKAAL